MKELDKYIAGIVRQLNRLGFFTSGSCDGHERRSAYVMITKEANIDELLRMLAALGMKRVNYRESSMHYSLRLPLARYELLNLAEKLSIVEKDWVPQGEAFIKKQMFNYLTEELLNIPGESGNEQLVRQVVKEKLTPFVDYITVDRHGNLIAEKNIQERPWTNDIIERTSRYCFRA